MSFDVELLLNKSTTGVFNHSFDWKTLPRIYYGPFQALLDIKSVLVLNNNNRKE